MALAALGEYFDGQSPVLIQYHIPTPALDPLATAVAKSRAAFYDVQPPPVTVFDGTNVIRGSQKSCDEGGPAKVFETYKQACLQPDAGKTLAGETHAAGSGWAIEGRLERRKSTISGSVQIVAPKIASDAVAEKTGDDLRLHIILCESPLMVPGATQ
jgi:hypothetical protein